MSTWGPRRPRPAPARARRCGSPRRWTSEPEGEGERAVQRPAHAELADHQAAEHRRDGERDARDRADHAVGLVAVAPRARAASRTSTARCRASARRPSPAACWPTRIQNQGPRSSSRSLGCRRRRRRRWPPRSTTRRSVVASTIAVVLAVVVDVGAERRADGGGRQAEGRRRSRRWPPPIGSRGTPRTSGRTRGRSSSPRSPACWRGGVGRRPARRAAGGDQSRARRSCR